jgi:glycosyltransferase involved in cell wall biosynthesis
MNTAPLVSVIIPCYNGARWLSATLESALAQTWPRVEIIVVDDGSRDESLAIARGFANQEVRVESIPNSGASAARNRGLALARGDYLQFLDADDLLSAEKIERQVRRLERAPENSVATCAWARFRASPSDAVFRNEPLWRDLAPVEWLVCSWREHVMMATASWLVPRRLAEKAGPWDASLGPNPVDDMEYFSRVLLAADAVLFCEEARVYYRSGIDGSLSRQRKDENWRAIFRSFQLTVDRLLARENSAATRLASATALQRLVFAAYPKVKDERRAAERRIGELGGTDLRPDTGPKRRLLQSLIGWKATKYLHNALQRRSLP